MFSLKELLVKVVKILMFNLFGHMKMTPPE